MVHHHVQKLLLLSTTSKQSIKSKLALIFAGTTLAVSVALPASADNSTPQSQRYESEQVQPRVIGPRRPYSTL